MRFFISTLGIGRLKVVNGNLKQVAYRDMDKRLLALICEWFSDKDRIFMFNGTPCHTDKTIKTHLDNHGTKRLDWPGNSLD